MGFCIRLVVKVLPSISLDRLFQIAYEEYYLPERFMKLLFVALWNKRATNLVAQKIEEQPRTLPSALYGLSMSGHSHPVF